MDICLFINVYVNHMITLGAWSYIDIDYFEINGKKILFYCRDVSII